MKFIKTGNKLGEILSNPKIQSVLRFVEPISKI